MTGTLAANKKPAGIAGGFEENLENEIAYSAMILARCE